MNSEEMRRSFYIGMQKHSDQFYIDNMRMTNDIVGQVFWDIMGARHFELKKCDGNKKKTKKINDLFNEFKTIIDDGSNIKIMQHMLKIMNKFWEE